MANATESGLSKIGIYDVVIYGAKVIDGTGNPWFYGDVALSGDRITRVTPAGRIDRSTAREVVEANGMIVCPGFIDIQSHSIAPFLTDRRSISKVTQGVTTEIMGELWTPAPFGGRRESPFLAGFSFVSEEIQQQARHWTRFHHWIDDLSGRGVSVNIGSFLGGATVREYARGWEIGDPTSRELETMCRITAEAMEDGAFGVATALIYPPNSYSTNAELIEIARVIGQYNGVYITHMRSEADRFLESLADTIDLGRQAKVAVEIYHLKAAGQRNWHKMREAIAMIDAARAEGIDVGADMYPYIAGGTGLDASLPPWAAADGKLLDNLRDPEIRARIRAEVLDPSGDWEPLGTLTGPENVLVGELRQPENTPYSGKRLAEIATARGQHWVDTLMDLVLSEGPWIGTIYFMMTEENLALQMRQPWMKFGTDAAGLDPDKPRLTHPRAYGNYPRILGKYVRDEKVLPLEDAIRKMSSAVADRLSIRDRGLLREGCYADVVIFDSQTVSDRATFDNPHQVSTGIRDVWVNGQRVLADGKHTGAFPGRPVYGPGRVN
ncbi:MAG: D-aminoacylase [Candidatus Tectomicrobia bacterium]|nr:D-aminoacylase [Candidatus Tectomicrobia bacterium]